MVQEMIKILGNAEVDLEAAVTKNTIRVSCVVLQVNPSMNHQTYMILLSDLEQVFEYINHLSQLSIG